ncbi:MAG: 2-phospho-L-lactate guanylyltransferase [Alphaproteobacteria bacterium]|nr:2-phospho-L-lactate guanylyltransferase [Alphaproteobacteria bacterium]
MNLWAIIPVKPFGLGKSRLASVLRDPQRADFNSRMFRHVLDAARDTLGSDRIAVVSTDPDALTLASPAHAVRESEPGDLNRALALAAEYAAQHGAEAILVLPADLPDLTREDIEALRRALDGGRCCAIAPDAAESGTNALAMTPPDESLFRFGADSFAAHVQAAQARGCRVTIVRRPGLAHDLDTPESYHAWLNRVGASA